MQVIEYEARRQVEYRRGRRGRSGDAAVRPGQRTTRDRCDRRKTRTITATSRTRTCCRSSSTRRSSRNAGRACRSCRTPSASATKDGDHALQCEGADRRGRDGALVRCPDRKRAPSPRAGANWVVAELFGAFNRLGKGIEESPVSPAQAASCSGSSPTARSRAAIAKQVLEIMLETGEGAAQIVESAASSRPATRARSTPIDRPDPRRQRRQGRRLQGGKQQLFGFFVGQVMKAMQGKANPQVVNERLRAKLD